MKHTTRHAQSRCPHCQYLMDASSSLKGEAVPGEGDFSLCLKCGAVLRYGQNLELHQADPRDTIELALTQPEAYAQIQKIRAAIAELNKENANPSTNL